MKTAPELPSSLFRAVAGGVLIALLAVACASTSSNQAAPTSEATTLVPKSGGQLAYGVETDPNGLDATRNAWDPVGLLVASSLFDTWAAFDANGVGQPYLAQSFDHTPDFQTWTIHIRPGITFSDGEKLDADAGVKMFNAIRASAVTGLATADIKDVVKIDDLSFRVEMLKPWANFPAILTGQGGYVMAPKQLDDPAGYQNPIGTGPFTLSKWDSEKVISVVRNDHYWRKDARGVQLPYLNGIDFHIIPDGAARTKALKSGSIDVTTAQNAPDVVALEQLPNDGSFNVIHDKGATDTDFVMLNTAKAPLDDVRVRQAIAYATNTQALVDPNQWKADRVATGVFAKDSKWNADVGFPTYNLEKAKALVADYAKDHGPIKFELTGAFETGVLQQLADQWAQAGITASVSVTEFKKYVLVAVSGNYDAELFHYFGTADPDTLWHFWSSVTARPVGGISLNFTRLSDPQIDAGVDDARATTDVPTRQAAFKKVQQRFADLVPYVWLYHTDWVIASRRGVHDVRNVSLPEGQTPEDYDFGSHRLTETWID